MTSLPLVDLRADCSRCTALCCVLLPYRRDAGFGADKAGGVPCPKLAEDDGCTIHAHLRERGWRGCDVFDCFGAGQHVTQVTYAGRSWREPNTDRGEMAAVLSVVRILHEMVRHLDEVLRRWEGDGQGDGERDGQRDGQRDGERDGDDPEARRLLATILDVRERDAEGLLLFDLEALHEEVGACLGAASRRFRTPGGAELAHADLAGQDLRGRDLRAADLRGALLIAADLRDVDLSRADLLGADLRDADLRGARLADALFVTEPQLASARGDGRTVIGPDLRTPGHWGAA